MTDPRDFLPPPPWEGPPIPKGLLRRKRSPEQYQELEDEVIQLLNEGLTYEQIANELNLTLSHVFNIARRSGRAPRRKRTREDYRRLESKVVELAGQDLTYGEIGERLGVAEIYVSTIIQRARKKLGV